MSHVARLFVLLAICVLSLHVFSAEPIEFSGLYPRLAMYNQEGECGTGAVVPWADRLWVISYGPHLPFGSSDKLYEIDSELNRAIRPESIGGTHANRMIHRESNQLFIGPYVIDANRNIRSIDSRVMPGRLTGNARHLVDPAHKIYFASMEEGFYEVDVDTLAVKTINLDGNAMKPADISGPLLPGYHGKGLYSAQGRLVYANNGENSAEARRGFDAVSGCLAEWDGADWNVVRRNQFTEVTGPGGILGNEKESDPLWSIGWDDRSLILMLLDGGCWSEFRLPKAAHTYDGAHGWNTEWPRIREIQPGFTLMTMHGMFWRFPKTFSAHNSAGIEPLSSYLKVIGDFCGWRGNVVFGCDDAAKSEFLTADVFNAPVSFVGQSNSNLWFVDPARLDDLGPVIGRGGPWKSDPVRAGEYSTPFLFNGFDRRMVHLQHDAGRPVEFTFEIDAEGTGDWKPLQSVTVPASGYAYRIFDPDIHAQWIRVKTDFDCPHATAWFQYANRDPRPVESDPLFKGLARFGEKYSWGLIRPRGDDLGTLHFSASRLAPDGSVEKLGYYEIGPDMSLHPVDDPEADAWMNKTLPLGEPLFTSDDASVLVIDARGARYRLPFGDESLREAQPGGWPRTLREAVTERSLFQCQGNWFELPRQNAGGFIKIRPIASADFAVMDFCSWRGMLVLSGVKDENAANPHIVRSSDGRCALWFGVIDDLWKLGKPRGAGAVWRNQTVAAGETSDPYLMTGYDRKQVRMENHSGNKAEIRIEVDYTGDGRWAPYETFAFNPGESLDRQFPEGFNAYWVRAVSIHPAALTCEFVYE
ncbi:MAG: hypothetical protein GC154_02175 [bacterium]|nr:hypothetical protein [bacterium]